MNQKVVLPRFDLPRDSTRIAMRALWAAGALMVVAVLVLGMAMWHRRSVEIATAEQAAAKAEAARRAAMAPPAPVAPVALKAPAAAPVGMAGNSETTMAAVIPPPAAAEPAHRSGASHSRRAGKSSAHGRPGARVSAAAGGKSASGAPAKRSKVDDDFIDKLLSK